MWWSEWINSGTNLWNAWKIKILSQGSAWKACKSETPIQVQGFPFEAMIDKTETVVRMKKEFEYRDKSTLIAVFETLVITEICSNYQIIRLFGRVIFCKCKFLIQILIWNIQLVISEKKVDSRDDSKLFEYMQYSDSDFKNCFTSTSVTFSMETLMHELKRKTSLNIKTKQN